jgi:hypothetical protein
MLFKVASFIRRAKSHSRLYTPVTISVRLFIGHGKNTWVLVSLAYGLPVFLILSGFLLSRKDIITHDLLTILLTYVAAIWAWLGPLFIWRYEHIITTEYWAMCRKIVTDKNELYKLRKSLKRSVLLERHGVILILLWCLLIIGTFFASYDFMKGFGITGNTDIWWYVQVFGIAIYAFFTGIGFLLIIRTFSLIKNFLPLDTSINPYHPDQRGGLGFFGRLLSETSLMFTSGTLYVPILMELYMDMYAEISIIVLIIIGIYALMIALSFVVPTWFIHKKLVKEKFNRLRKLSITLEQLQGWLDEEGIERYWKFTACRDQYHDMSRIITWPFDTQNLITIIASVGLPIVLTALQIYLLTN